MKDIEAKHSLATLISFFFAATLVGCSTSKAIDPTSTIKSPAEAIEVLKKDLWVGNFFVRVNDTGLSMNPRWFIAGCLPSSKDNVVFAEVSKIVAEKGAQGDWIAIYGKGNKRLTKFATGRNDAINDRVALSLRILCPNSK